MREATWWISGAMVIGAIACAPPKTAMPAAAAPAAQARLATAIGEPEESPRAPKVEEPEAVPDDCGAEATFGKGTKLCMPADAYARKLCGGIYPEVALALHAKGTPFTRLYLAGDVEAWNASGGLTHRARLAFDEEVIVLAKHAPGGSGGVVMTGMQASYDVLRWDGTCVSVMEGEITAKRPPAPKPAPIPYDRLEEPTRRALLASPKVKAARDALGKACASVSTDAEKKKCEKADRAFVQSIVDHVRSGGALPAPARRP